MDLLVRRGAMKTGAVDDAMRSVPRHIFLPGVALEEVYDDRAIVTRRDEREMPCSSSSQPAIVAIMLEQLEAETGHAVLEVGAGTGWNAALLAHLVGTDGRVVTMDIDDDITAEARSHLDEAGYADVTVVSGDGWLGYPEQAPYDRIVATVGVSDLSPAWLDQLEPDGALLVPLWIRAGVQVTVAFQRVPDGSLESRSVRPCGFMRLRGPHAGAERYEKVAGWDVPDEGRIDLERLRNLLSLVPSEQEVSLVPPTVWFRMLLEEPGSCFVLGRVSDGRMAFGLFDAESAAVIEGGTLRSYGGASARDSLLHKVEVTAPLEVEKLRIEARRIDGGVAEVGFVRRRHFDFLITEPAES